MVQYFMDNWGIAVKIGKSDNNWDNINSKKDGIKYY